MSLLYLSYKYDICTVLKAYHYFYSCNKITPLAVAYIQCFNIIYEALPMKLKYDRQVTLERFFRKQIDILASP